MNTEQQVLNTETVWKGLAEDGAALLGVTERTFYKYASNFKWSKEDGYRNTVLYSIPWNWINEYQEKRRLNSERKAIKLGQNSERYVTRPEPLSEALEALQRPISVLPEIIHNEQSLLVTVLQQQISDLKEQLETQKKNFETTLASQAETIRSQQVTIESLNNERRALNALVKLDKADTSNGRPWWKIW